MTAPRRHTAPVRRQRDDDGDLLTSHDLRQRAQDARRRRDAEQAAHQAWEAGRVCPHRITIALDIRRLYGPEVDRACGAEEPAVDEWETGVRYPTWEQLCALAELTDFDVRFFTPEPDEIHPLGPGVAFICKRSRPSWDPRTEIPAPILAFTPDAITAGVRGYCVACLDPRPGARAIHTCEQTAIPLEVG
jgi:transcriptional regulator with XRE-family HTH domain